MRGLCKISAASARRLLFFSTVVALAVVQTAPAAAYSQSAGAAGASQPSSSSAPTAGSTPQTGVTTGTSPIEATELAYKALSADATLIANQISPRIRGSRVVVGSAADVNAIIQFRIVMAEGELLTNRLKGLAGQLQCPAPPKPTRESLFDATTTASTGLLGNASNFQTIVQTLAAITAVNQSEGAGVVSPSDATLMADVAQKLRGAAVLTPSVYPPGLFSSSDLTNTNFSEMLDRLEQARGSAVVLVDSCGKDASQTAKASAVAALIQSTSAQVDAFEASLLSGGSATAAANPAQPQTGGQAGNQGSSSSPPAAQPSGSALLPQIFYADLLLRALGPSTSDVHFLAVHALEAGGGAWTHSNLFAGSWLSFSGGAVASYTLFDPNGAFQCGGIAYSYRGIVDGKLVEYSLQPSTGLAATTTGTCGPNYAPPSP